MKTLHCAFAIALVVASCIFAGCTTTTPDSERSGYGAAGHDSLIEQSDLNSDDDDSSAWEEPWFFLQTMLYGFCSGDPSFGTGK